MHSRPLQWWLVPQLLLMLMVLLSLAACSNDPGTGPKEVKWDRVTCERCRMVLSDRHFSAQVRYTPEGKKRTKVLYFDDIGCATLWLEDKPWNDDPMTEIWVTDHRNGKWIDARTATYVKDKLTPMEYGLGAQPEAEAGGLTYNEAKAHVVKIEERFTQRGVQLLDRLRDQADKRDAARKAQQQESNHEHN